jgi:hypothetical protein
MQILNIKPDNDDWVIKTQSCHGGFRGGRDLNRKWWMRSGTINWRGTCNAEFAPALPLPFLIGWVGCHFTIWCIIIYSTHWRSLWFIHSSHLPARHELTCPFFPLLHLWFTRFPLLLDFVFNPLSRLLIKWYQN